MERSDIPQMRLLNQRLAGEAFKAPGEVVRWLGAVQAQDYPAAKWALGLRLQTATDASLDSAFNQGTMLRTHVMRPTWHFLTPEDIRWMLALTAPRVHAANGTMYRRLELDPATLARSTEVLVKTLAGGHSLTREELRGALQQVGMEVGIGQRLAYIVMNAELNGVICSGPRRGKKFTYMLLDERATAARALERDQALAELVRRYFASHGPATIQDFTWWSGLTAADAREGLEMVKSQLVVETIDGKTYYFSPEPPPARNLSPRALLLPNFDEYGSYQDRSDIIDPASAGQFEFNHLLVIDGKARGTWKRELGTRVVAVQVSPVGPLGEDERQAVDEAVGRYGAFLGLPVIVT